MWDFLDDLFAKKYCDRHKVHMYKVSDGVYGCALCDKESHNKMIRDSEAVNARLKAQGDHDDIISSIILDELILITKKTPLTTKQLINKRNKIIDLLRFDWGLKPWFSYERPKDFYKLINKKRKQMN